MTLEQLKQEAHGQIAELKYNPDKIPTVSVEISWEDFIELQYDFQKSMPKPDLNHGEFIMSINLPTIAYIHLISNGK